MLLLQNLKIILSLWKQEQKQLILPKQGRTRPTLGSELKNLASFAMLSIPEQYNNVGLLSDLQACQDNIGIFLHFPLRCAKPVVQMLGNEQKHDDSFLYNVATRLGNVIGKRYTFPSLVFESKH